MTRVLSVTATTVLCVVLLCAVSAPVARGDDFSTVAIFATNSARLKPMSKVLTGDVIVNDVATSTPLPAGKELTIDNKAATPAGFAVKAHRIKTQKSADLAGELFCNELTVNGRNPGLECQPLNLPVFDLLPPFHAASSRPEAEDVLVDQNELIVLPEGDYATVQIEDHGTVLFTGGIYNLHAINSGDGSELLFAAPSEVRVANEFLAGSDSFIGPEDAAAIDASGIIFYVGGVAPETARFGPRATVLANLYVPYGTLVFAQGTSATGAFLGREVVVGTKVEVSLDSAFGNRPPAAHPQDVLTNGDDPLVITLTGSDPDNDDLTFAIEPGFEPTEGTWVLVEDPAPFPGDPPGCRPEQPGCVPSEPPRTSATVTYTPFTADDVEDSFTFRVEDGTGGYGLAVVRINPPGDPTPDPPPIATVIASDGSVETVTGTAVTITLTGDAPEQVDLTFSIPSGSEPEHGTLDDLTQGTESPVRTATVTYTPDLGAPPEVPPFSGEDGFGFEACGLIAGVHVCDPATVRIGVVEPLPLAEDQEVTTEANAPVEVTLTGNSGGVGDSGGKAFSAPSVASKAAFLLEAGVVGAVTDTDGDGFGDEVVSGEVGIDFETPSLGPTEPNRAIDPYTDGGVVFTAAPGVVGLVKNSATSACVEPSNDDQKLGMGIDAGSIGFSSIPIRAVFPSPLPPGAEVTAEFQTRAGEPIRIRLFDAQDQEVGSATALASPPDGTCGYPGDPRARTTLSATSSGPVAYAIMDLGASTGSFVFVIDDFSFTSTDLVTAGIDHPDLGERRIHIEWDLSQISIDPESLESATVTVNTVKGEDDTLDTLFFAGTEEQDGLLTAADFEAGAEQIAGAVMPVPADPVGTEGTFSFDVESALQNAINRDDTIDIFSIQGRVDPDAIMGQGLQVRTSPLPTLAVTTPGLVAPLVYSIVTLPTFGTLTDSDGVAVSIGEPLPSPVVTFTPGGQTGVTSFTYQVEQGVVQATAEVIVTVLIDSCVAVGREPGCAPNP